MCKKIIFLIFIVIFAAAFFALFKKSCPLKARLIPNPKEKKTIQRIGETIIYGVYMGKVRLGEAVFKHLPMEEINGKQVNLMTFETRVVRFTDLEKIYSDPETFLPLRVERYISTWPQSETITEDYDQEKFILTINKIKGKGTKKTVIKKNNVINNAILLPFYVRNIAKLSLGYNLVANLPIEEFVIELVAKEKVKVPAGEFLAYRFVSEPKKFLIWISADEDRIPLKIKGSSGLGYTLVMKKYIR